MRNVSALLSAVSTAQIEKPVHARLLRKRLDRVQAREVVRRFVIQSPDQLHQPAAVFGMTERGERALRA